MGCDIQPWASPQDRRRAATKVEDPYCEFDVNRTEGSPLPKSSPFCDFQHEAHIVITYTQPYYLQWANRRHVLGGPRSPRARQALPGTGRLHRRGTRRFPRRPPPIPVLTAVNKKSHHHHQNYHSSAARDFHSSSAEETSGIHWQRFVTENHRHHRHRHHRQRNSGRCAAPSSRVGSALLVELRCPCALERAEWEWVQMGMSLFCASHRRLSELKHPRPLLCCK